MAKKLDTGAVNTGRIETGVNTGAVHDTIEKGKAKRLNQTPAPDYEIKERKAQLRTKGRKGCRAERINMAFTPDNYDFIKTMASITAVSMTEYVNNIIDLYREQNSGLYEKVVAFKKQNEISDKGET